MFTVWSFYQTSKIMLVGKPKCIPLKSSDTQSYKLYFQSSLIYSFACSPLSKEINTLDKYFNILFVNKWNVFIELYVYMLDLHWKMSLLCFYILYWQKNSLLTLQAKCPHLPEYTMSINRQSLFSPFAIVRLSQSLKSSKLQVPWVHSHRPSTASSVAPSQ